MTSRPLPRPATEVMIVGCSTDRRCDPASRTGGPTTSGARSRAPEWGDTGCNRAAGTLPVSPWFECTLCRRGTEQGAAPVPFVKFPDVRDHRGRLRDYAVHGQRAFAAARVDGKAPCAGFSPKIPSTTFASAKQAHASAHSIVCRKQSTPGEVLCSCLAREVSFLQPGLPNLRADHPDRSR